MAIPREVSVRDKWAEPVGGEVREMRPYYYSCSGGGDNAPATVLRVFTKWQITRLVAGNPAPTHKLVAFY